MLDTILKYREYKILRNACAQFISTYIHKIGNSKRSVSLQLDRVFIIVCNVEMNNFTCFVLFCVAFLNPCLSLCLIDHLWIDMLKFQDKHIKQVNFFDMYAWIIDDTAFLTLYIQSICIRDRLQHCKNTEIVLFPHFTWDQSHKSWWIAFLTKS